MIYYIHACWLDNVYIKFIHSQKERKILIVFYEYGLYTCFMFQNNFLFIRTLWGENGEHSLIQKEKRESEKSCVSEVLLSYRKNH